MKTTPPHPTSEERMPEPDIEYTRDGLPVEPEDEEGAPPVAAPKFAEGLCVEKVVWIFLIGSLIGFCVETLWCYVTTGTIESRKGVLYGPFTPIYGFGGVLMTLALYRVRQRNGLFIFLASAAIGMAFEFLCSWLQEMVLGTISWDYSGTHLNLAGRVNAQYGIFWGVLGLLFIRHAYPFLSRYIERLPVRLGRWLTWVLVVFMLVNMLLSSVAVRRWTDRQLGLAPANVVEQTMDRWYPDDRMQAIYPNMKLVE